MGPPRQARGRDASRACRERLELGLEFEIRGESGRTRKVELRLAVKQAAQSEDRARCEGLFRALSRYV